MSVDVTLLRALTAAANSLRFNPEIAPENAEIYEQLLIELRDDLGRELTKNVTPPPNDPLTLEQLREMDGEPVWWWNTTQKPTCTICVFKKYMPEPTFVTYDFAREDESKIVKYSRMKKWGYKPYRRKPEEGEHE